MRFFMLLAVGLFFAGMVISLAAHRIHSAPLRGMEEAGASFTSRTSSPMER
jgi:hypothetical protein